MEQIRLMAQRFSLTWRLSQIVEAAQSLAGTETKTSLVCALSAAELVGRSPPKRPI